MDVSVKAHPRWHFRRIPKIRINPKGAFGEMFVQKLGDSNDFKQ